MNPRNVFVVVLALVLGLTAAIAVHQIASRPGHDQPSDQVDVLIAVGQHAAMMASRVSQRCPRRIAVHAYPNTAAACREIAAHLQSADTILLKGSRAMGLEALVEEIRRWTAGGRLPASNAA